MTEKETPRFETALAELEQAAADIKSEQLGLEESIRRYEEGMNAYRICRECLDSAKQKIERYNKETGNIEEFQEQK